MMERRFNTSCSYSACRKAEKKRSAGQTSFPVLTGNQVVMGSSCKAGTQEDVPASRVAL